MGGVELEDCFPIFLVFIFFLVGVAIAIQGASTNEPMLMSVGLIIALGTVVLALGGRMKFKL